MALGWLWERLEPVLQPKIVDHGERSGASSRKAVIRRVALEPFAIPLLPRWRLFVDRGRRILYQPATTASCSVLTLSLHTFCALPILSD